MVPSIVAGSPGRQSSTFAPKISWVSSWSPTWNRGSALESLESMSSRRPLSGVALFAAGKLMANRGPGPG